jgi:prepilin signal peptidase PulO-like enzyme (type II secretory pathway)
MTLSVAVLITALLFGGMTLYSFGFAALLFTALPAETAGLALRRAFPPFYLFVIVTAVLASAFLWPNDSLAGALMALVAITTVPARQALMPAINRATDTGQRRHFKWLHGLSVLITLAHIAAAGFVLVRLV